MPSKTLPPAATSLDAFDWRLVRSFLAVLDAGSLMAAARRLKVHQPTLSRHVAELERQLAAPLFERTGRGVVPTATALAIADAARRMEEGAEALAHTLAGRRDATAGSVRITTSQVAANWLLPPVLVELRREEPGIQIDLVASNQVTNLLRREADIAVRMVRPSQGSLVARKLGEIGIGAYAHSGYLARAGSPRRLDDLPSHALIGFDRDDTIVRGFAAAGLALSREHFPLRSDDQVAYIQLVAAGAGIGFITHYVARLLPGLQRVLAPWQAPSLPCWLAVHREIRSSRVVRRVYDFLAARLPAAIGESPP